MSKIEVNAIEPQCGTTLTVGAVGTTVAVPSNVVKSNALQASDAGNIISQSGTTITLGATGDSINLASGATQSGFGRTGTVDWDTTPKTGTFTAVSGNGYFVDTSGAVSTANLPAGVAGAIVSFADYTRTFQTNNLTITPNGSEKIGGVAANFVAQTEGQSITLIYVDETEGWINTAESTGQSGLNPAFITATGGTITTVDTDYKVHTFTGPGTFTVCSAGNPLGSSTVDYMVVAGGGGGGTGTSSAAAGGAGGGGAGGFRETTGCGYTSSPLGACVSSLPVAATGYPITVGAGGTAPHPGSANDGSNSVFAAITSTGGGGGGSAGLSGLSPGNPGGSGGGGGGSGNSGSGTGTGGSGNTPAVNPAQGTNGGTTTGPSRPAAGGGGATVVGENGGPTDSPTAAFGGAGATTSINGSPTAFAGGGGGGRGSLATGGTGGTGGGGTGAGDGGASTAGTTNTGGGGGGSGDEGAPSLSGSSGGSGIVIIRYKFQ